MACALVEQQPGQREGGGQGGDDEDAATMHTPSGGVTPPISVSSMASTQGTSQNAFTYSQNASSVSSLTLLTSGQPSQQSSQQSSSLGSLAQLQVSTQSSNTASQNTAPAQPGGSSRTNSRAKRGALPPTDNILTTLWLRRAAQQQEQKEQKEQIENENETKNYFEEKFDENNEKPVSLSFAVSSADKHPFGASAGKTRSTTLPSGVNMINNFVMDGKSYLENGQLQKLELKQTNIKKSINHIYSIFEKINKELDKNTDKCNSDHSFQHFPSSTITEDNTKNITGIVAGGTKKFFLVALYSYGEEERNIERPNMIQRIHNFVLFIRRN